MQRHGNHAAQMAMLAVQSIVGHSGHTQVRVKQPENPHEGWPLTPICNATSPRLVYLMLHHVCKLGQPSIEIPSRPHLLAGRWCHWLTRMACSPACQATDRRSSSHSPTEGETPMAKSMKGACTTCRWCLHRGRRTRMGSRTCSATYRRSSSRACSSWPQRRRRRHRRSSGSRKRRRGRTPPGPASARARALTPKAQPNAGPRRLPGQLLLIFLPAYCQVLSRNKSCRTYSMRQGTACGGASKGRRNQDMGASVHGCCCTCGCHFLKSL